MRDGRKGRNDLTRLQIDLMDPKTKHHQHYPDQCNLISHMLNFEPGLRPTCDKIICNIETKLTDKFQRQTSRSLARQYTEEAAGDTTKSCDSADPLLEGPLPLFLDQSMYSRTLGIWGYQRRLVACLQIHA